MTALVHQVAISWLRYQPPDDRSQRIQTARLIRWHRQQLRRLRA